MTKKKQIPLFNLTFFQIPVTHLKFDLKRSSNIKKIPVAVSQSEFPCLKPGKPRFSNNYGRPEIAENMGVENLRCQLIFILIDERKKEEQRF